MDSKTPRPLMPVHKVVILGDGGVGKTTMTAIFVQEHFIECYDPTGPGEDRKQVLVDGKAAIIEILECVSREEYVALREFLVNSGDCFALVFSLTSRNSFSRVRFFYDEVRRRKVLPVPLVLLGNKSDLCAEHRDVSSEEGEALAKEMGCDYFETSAKLNTNITDAFHQLVRLDREKEEREDEEKKAKEREQAKNSTENKAVRKQWKKRLSGLFSRLGRKETTL